MDFQTLVAEGTQRAAIRILINQGLADEANARLEELAAALKETVTQEYDTVLAEMKEATECRMGEAFLKMQLNTSLNYLAIKAIKKICLLN